MAKQTEKPKKEKKPREEVEMPLWNGRQIVDPSHAHDLEQRSAILEFEGKLPKEDAENKAHAEYRREQQLKAAARHFSGMKAAKATGDQSEAKKHHAMYALHLQSLGHNPNGPVPKEVEHHMESAKTEPHYRFQAAPADAYILSEGKKSNKTNKKLEKALPRSQKENAENERGFLNNPVAQDAYMEGTGAVPKVHNTEPKYGTVPQNQATELRPTHHFFDGSSMPSEVRTQNFNQHLGEDDHIGLEPHNQAMFRAPNEERNSGYNAAGDNDAEKLYWSGVKNSVKGIRMRASGKAMLPTQKSELEKGWPKTEQENQANAAGFLNHPVAMDNMLETGNLTPQEHTTHNNARNPNQKPNPAARLVDDKATHYNTLSNTPIFEAHSANFHNSRNPATPRKLPIQKPLFDIDLPSQENPGSPADKQAEANYWQDTEAQSKGLSLAQLRARAKKKKT